MLLNISLILASLSIIWVILLTIFVYKVSAHYNKLVKNINEKTLKSVLEKLIGSVNQNKKDIDFLKNYCDTIQKEGQFHVQKIGLLRFNPFKDTGGDQSFIVTLVDKNDTGVIISGLYSRSGTRWYAKKVVNGKGVEHDLSDEEKKALKEAGKV